MLSRDGHVKVMDFGVAHAEVRSSKTATGVLKGKLAYMAPEQALGKGEMHRTDLYSLGLIVYELLMGKPAYRIPYEAEDPVKEIFQDICSHITFDRKGGMRDGDEYRFGGSRIHGSGYVYRLEKSRV